jgi:hypothetical protein
MNNIRYIYIRDSKWEPQGCIALRVSRSKNRVEYGLSVRNPLDAKDGHGRSVKFNRRLAQQMATKRLLDIDFSNGSNGRAYIPTDATQNDVSFAVLCDIIASGCAPTRAVRFAKARIKSIGC